MVAPQRPLGISLKSLQLLRHRGVARFLRHVEEQADNGFWRIGKEIRGVRQAEFSPRLNIRHAALPIVGFERLGVGGLREKRCKIALQHRGLQRVVLQLRAFNGLSVVCCENRPFEDNACQHGAVLDKLCTARAQHALMESDAGEFGKVVEDEAVDVTDIADEIHTFEVGKRGERVGADVENVAQHHFAERC